MDMTYVLKFWFGWAEKVSYWFVCLQLKCKITLAKGGRGLFTLDANSFEGFVSCTSCPFGKVIEIPQLSHQYVNLRVVVLPIHVALTTLKKNTIPHIQQPTGSFLGFTPHQSPPSYSDLANRRNLVLQLHTPRSSLLRFKTFLCLWTLVKFHPNIMRSATHNLQTCKYGRSCHIYLQSRYIGHVRLKSQVWVIHSSSPGLFYGNGGIIKKEEQ